MTVNVQQYEYVTQAGDTAGIVVGILPQQQMPFPDDDDVITSWSAFCRSSRCLSPTTTTSSHRGRHSAATADAFPRGRRHHIVVDILPQQQMPFPDDYDVITSWSTFCLSSRCLSPTTTSSHRGRHSASAADAFPRGRRHRRQPRTRHVHRTCRGAKMLGEFTGITCV